jgi:hypothetical protein
MEMRNGDRALNTNQLSIFDTPTPESSPELLNQKTICTGTLDKNFAPETRVCITQSSPPLEHLNGRMGTILSVTPGFASVQVEGIAVAMMLRVEAIEQYSEISQYIATHEEVTDLIIVGSLVECDRAYLGLSGVVRRVEPYCGVMVAWVDYGDRRPWYPAPLESLNLA